jgi:hypothetical protein
MFQDFQPKRWQSDFHVCIDGSLAVIVKDRQRSKETVLQGPFLAAQNHEDPIQVLPTS